MNKSFIDEVLDELAQEYDATSTGTLTADTSLELEDLSLDDLIDHELFEGEIWEQTDPLAADKALLIQDAFADAMDATTHDAFLRRAWAALRRQATPPAQHVTRRTLPVVSRLLRTGQMAAARRTRPPVAPAQLPRAASERLRQQRLIRLSHHPDPRVREGARTELRRLGGGITSRQDPGLLARLPQAGRRGRIARQLRGRSGGDVEPPSEDEGPSEDERRQEEHRQMLQEQWEDSVRQWTETMQEAAQQPDRLYVEERGDMIDDAVDTFADAAALLAESEDDLDLMIPVLAGLTARRAIRELVPPV